MSSNAAISVSHLTKQYKISGSNTTRSAAEQLTYRLTHPFSRNVKRTFTALNDVSFDVQPGEAVGIIGHNGAGKSTLLKVLTRITRPTSGEVRLTGRVGSLLEVGTGFHSELTGRENIYLNGAILGMKTAEITAAFDEIVEFSGVSEFLDTPVKRYSSGMTVRLAFSVAAHLRCDILLVDEVLAVGDAEFQTRSKDKMDSLTHSGRTVLLVSHSMEYVTALCSRAILMDHGRPIFDGPVQEGTQRYFESVREFAATPGSHLKRDGSGQLRISKFVPRKTGFSTDEPKVFDVSVDCLEPIPGNVVLSFSIFADSGEQLVQGNSSLLGLNLEASRSSTGTFVLKTPWLQSGTYYIHAFLGQAGLGMIDAAHRICEFYVDPIVAYPFGHDASSYSQGAVLGSFDLDMSPVERDSH
jgi:lipopolysaccharide transport system ATP-binding protein